MNEKDMQAKIYVAGHRGMVGSAILRRLQASGGAVEAAARVFEGEEGPPTAPTDELQVA